MARQKQKAANPCAKTIESDFSFFLEKINQKSLIWSVKINVILLLIVI